MGTKEESAMVKFKYGITPKRLKWGVLITVLLVVIYLLLVNLLWKDYLEGLVQYFKYLFVIIGAVSGVIGMIFKSRDKKDQLTSKGIFLLFLIVTSGLLSLASQAIEYSLNFNKEEDKRIKTESIINQNNRIISDLIRTSNPITEFSVYYQINYPLNEDYALGYKKRVEQLRSALINTPKDVKNPIIEGAGIMSGGSDNPNRLYTIANFKYDSKYFPDSQEENRVWLNLETKQLQFAFIRDSMSLYIKKRIDEKCDLCLRTTSSVRDRDDKYSHWLTVNTSGTGITLRTNGFNTVKENEWLRDSGSITSIMDLLGSYMLIYEPGRNMYFNFEVLKIRLALGKTLLINPVNIESVLLDSGMMYHIYRFPSSIDSLPFEGRYYPYNFY